MAYIPFRQSYQGVKGFINKYLPNFAKKVDNLITTSIHSAKPKTAIGGLTPQQFKEVAQNNLYYGRNATYGLRQGVSIFNG